MKERRQHRDRLGQPHIGMPAGTLDGRRYEVVHMVHTVAPAAAMEDDVEHETPISGIRQMVSLLHPGSMLRIAFGLIWLVDMYFKWQPSFLNGLLDVIHDGATGQPSWLLPWFRIVRAIVATQPTVWAYSIAVVETGIALALLLGVARKVTYIGGAIWSLFIWATAEGFGRTPSGEIATDIGAAIIYTIVFVALLTMDQCAETRPYSLDTVIERHVPWWTRVAEVRR